MIDKSIDTRAVATTAAESMASAIALNHLQSEAAKGKRADFRKAKSAGRPEGPANRGPPSLGYLSWRSKKGDQPPGCPRRT